MENTTNNTQKANQTQDANMQPPDNYLVWAILSTVICCMPLGIVSLVKSNQVNQKWAMGDYEGAEKASKDAKKYAIWSAGAAVIVWILYFVFAGAIMSSQIFESF